jgi:hypothetical protein
LWIHPLLSPFVYSAKENKVLSNNNIEGKADTLVVVTGIIAS